MMEDLQNSSFAGNDDLLSDIPPAVVAGNDEHAARRRKNHSPQLHRGGTTARKAPKTPPILP